MHDEVLKALAELHDGEKKVQWVSCVALLRRLQQLDPGLDLDGLVPYVRELWKRGRLTCRTPERVTDPNRLGSEFHCRLVR